MSAIRWTTGYCTNIHPGPDLPTLRSNLVEFVSKVRNKAFPDSDMGVGLWIANPASQDLLESPQALEELRGLLSELCLTPYTLNGFPFGNFHQPVVKHLVYQPTWCEPDRLAYTRNLVGILGALLPSTAIGSISTLPIAWGSLNEEQFAQAARNLMILAHDLHEHEQKTGQRIVVAIEPEPGCALDTSHDMVEFFQRYLSSPLFRRYLTVCHDVCHSAVMFETQTEVLARYAANEITVGKIQVSSAIQVNWSEMDSETKTLAHQHLSSFAEDRYLHQTGRMDELGHFELAEDLPQLLRTDAHLRDHAWCIHFHVPIFLDRFDYFSGTRGAIIECLQAIEQTPSTLCVDHLEVETYAWGVLPPAMRQQSLADSIAMEMSWLNQTLSRSGSETCREDTGP